VDRLLCLRLYCIVVCISICTCVLVKQVQGYKY
jgi:hypothetical protein